MRRALLALIVAAFAGLAAAQERAFVQIEAHPEPVEANARARAYEAIVSDINGFRLGSGWFAIALGPYPPAEARTTLGSLRAEGLIPRDSYISDGDAYRERFWPVGAEAASVEPEAADDTLGAALAAIERAETAEGAPTTPRAPDETVPEARRSEATLSRAERMELQSAMQWFGQYGGAIDGAIGRGTRAAMGDWQAEAGDRVTGVLTTRQRARLLSDWRASQAALGLEPLRVAEAGIALTAPMGLVTFDRIEAPFVHYAPQDESGVRLSLISQAGDRTTLGGLYEILQTLDLVPPEGSRSRSGDAFRITGLAPDRTTQVEARLIDGHVVGYILSWPEAQDALAARALPEMSRTLASIGPALPEAAGFDAGGAELRHGVRAGGAAPAPLRRGLLGRRGRDGRDGRGQRGGLRPGHARRAARGHRARERDGVAVLAPRARSGPGAGRRAGPRRGTARAAPSRSAAFPTAACSRPRRSASARSRTCAGSTARTRVLRLSLRARDGDVGGPVLDAAGRVAGMLLPAPAAGRPGVAGRRGVRR